MSVLESRHSPVIATFLIGWIIFQGSEEVFHQEAVRIYIVAWHLLISSANIG
jgi:hypothetical protein